MSKTLEISMFYTTVSTKDDARAIAKALVESGKVICVNIVDGVESFYNLDAKLEKSNEVIIIIKAIAESADEVEKLILKLHPYSIPCLLSIKTQSLSDKYNKWIDDLLHITY